MSLRPTAILFAASLAASLPQSARADLIGDWNEVANRTLTEANVSGNLRARALAMVHAAMFDAVNAVEKRYSPIVGRIEAAPRASAVAAAAGAAHSVLLQAAPGQKAKLDQALADSLTTISIAEARAMGVAAGERAAAAVIADRLDDALAAPDTYRPSPPPALASAQYARDYNETKSLGGRASTARTPAQTDAVRFWTEPNLVSATDQVARQLALEKKLSLSESARFFAQLNLAVANTFRADWDARFTSNFWRPVTAIRNGDQDGNDATEHDASWTPFAATPMHPEYPSQAGMIAAVLQTIVERQFGANAGPVTITDTANPALKRTFGSVAELAQEMREVRIWGGIHFRSSLDVSAAIGRRIADDILAGYMKTK